MSNQASTSDIVSFLVQAKKLMQAGDYVFVPRKKNLQALAYQGYTIKDVKNELYDLKVSDYYKGPKRDFDPDHSGAVWEFKKAVGGKQFYVKLKIQNQNGKDVLKCLSFHEDEFELHERRTSQ